jgi:thioredoxin reductase (NADPH)
VIAVELLVVGSGPAGVAAALHARQQDLDVLLVGDEPPGGLARAARRIDNLPGLPAIAGARLGQRLQRQLERSGVACRPGRLLQLARRDAGFVAEHGGGTIAARCAILACGTRPRGVELEGWTACLEQGRAHRDARSLPRTLDGARVLVLGGGEVALDTALTCSDRGARVAVAVRGATPRARSQLVVEVQRAGIELWPQVRALRCTVDAHGACVELEGPGAPHARVVASHVVACIGREPERSLLRGLGLVVDGDSAVATSVPGLFVAGDLRRSARRYIAPAVGDGVQAACLAHGVLRPGSRHEVER